MFPTIKSIEDVAALQLCSGCGVCAFLEPDRYAMADSLEYGRRPLVRENAAVETGVALRACPGVHLEQLPSKDMAEGAIPDLQAAWGPVLAVWEGHAKDSAIRYAGSSGGAATALALHCIDQQAMSGVLHVAARIDFPYLNETVYSQNRAHLLERAGSRYAPSSPCDGLARIESAEAPSVLIGKPCDIAAAQNAAQSKPALLAKLGLTIGIFCAGAPSTIGTLSLLKHVGLPDPSRVVRLRYRGQGWPGNWVAETSDGEAKRLNYAESWGYLQRFRPWRCYVCPDHSGEFADVAVGDPWYRKPDEGSVGSSLIVARTRRGVEAVLAAERDGYLVLEGKNPTLLPRSQPNLLNARGALWGRLLGLRLMGAPVPRFSGFPMFRFWWNVLTAKEKVKSVAGTMKRVITKRLRQRAVIQFNLSEGRRISQVK